MSDVYEKYPRSVLQLNVSKENILFNAISRNAYCDLLIKYSPLALTHVNSQGAEYPLLCVCDLLVEKYPESLKHFSKEMYKANLLLADVDEYYKDLLVEKYPESLKWV